MLLYKLCIVNIVKKIEIYGMIIFYLINKFRYIYNNDK